MITNFPGNGLLRHLTLLTLKNNIDIRAKHIPSKYNEIADSLSRFQSKVPASSTRYSTQNSSPSAENLEADVQHHIYLSVAASTKQTYSAGEKRFIAFINLYRPQEVRYLLLACEAGALGLRGGGE